VTHRTDDMSKLPPVQPPVLAGKPKQAMAAQRPKLALLSARRPAAGIAAPPVPDMSAAEVAMSTVAVEQPPVMPEEGAYTQCVLWKIHDFAVNKQDLLSSGSGHIFSRAKCVLSSMISLHC
jgi:hypothetical protein